MTNRIALVLAMMLAAAISLGWAVSGPDIFVFLAKKLVELIEWLAFWR